VSDPINTISDKQMADLSHRASKANPMFDPKTVKQRLASQAQQRKANHS